LFCKNTTNQKGLSYLVTLSPGGSADQSSRIAKNGTNSVMYNLFKNSTFTQILDGGNSSTFSLDFFRNWTRYGTKVNLDNLEIYEI